MNKLDQIAEKIVREQEAIVGPIAWQQAMKVEGLHVTDQAHGNIHLEDNNGKKILDNLVSQYEHLFGKASREVCKEAAASILAELLPSEIPLSLQ